MPINLLYRESSTETPPSKVSVKDAPLTSLEVDANFKSISNKTDSIETNVSTISSDIESLKTGKAETDHSSSLLKYGLGIDLKYGHLKIVDEDPDGIYTAATAVSASPKLVSDSISNYKTEFEGILDNLIDEYS